MKFKCGDILIRKFFILYEDEYQKIIEKLHSVNPDVIEIVGVDLYNKRYLAEFSEGILEESEFFIKYFYEKIGTI